MLRAFSLVENMAPMSLDFLLTALIVVLAPGTGVIYTVATGLGQGRAPSAAAAFGCTLGIVPHILASALGLAAILHTSAVVFQLLKFAGAAYLIYLAWVTIKDRGPVRFDAAGGRRTYAQNIKTGFLINILNPKLSIFFLAFLPQFIGQQVVHKTLHMLELGAVFMVMTLIVFIIYGVFAAHVRELVLGSRTIMNWFRRISALAFGALGVRLALSSQ
jgi:threonine/homoserine/homoserine lactone efflux protein